MSRLWPVSSLVDYQSSFRSFVGSSDLEVDVSVMGDEGGEMG